MERIRRAIAMLLAAIMCISVCPVSAFATETETETTEALENAVLTYGDYLYTVLSDGTVSVCGYTGEAEELLLKIPSEIDGMTVTAVADRAFSGCKGLEAVLIPEDVTSLGEAAFEDAGDLKVLAFCGEIPDCASTVAAGCDSLAQIFVLEDSDVSKFCQVLAADLGTETADRLEVLEFTDRAALAEGFETCLDQPLETETATVSETDAGTETSADPESNGTDAEAETVPAKTVYILETSPGTVTSDDTESDGTEDTETTAATEESESTIEETVIASGTCGSNLAWVLTESGTLTISGTGAMTNYSSYSSVPWYSYRSSITSLVLTEEITSIGNYAFYFCSKLTGTLIIPDSVTSIGAYAFYSCTGLTGDLIIPNSVTSVGNRAFYGCTGFNGTLTLSENLTSIGTYTFYNCTGFTGDLIIPNGVTSIGTYIFYNCTGFTGDLIIPNGVTSIGAYTFYSCTGFTGDLIIPNSVTTIGSYSFRYLQNVTQIVFGSSVSSIDYTAFYNCTGVTEIAFDGVTVPSINGNMFTSMSKLEAVSVPAESYSAYAEALCGYLANSVQLVPNGTVEEPFLIQDNILIAYLGEYTVVEVPDDVTAIGPAAFRNCTAVTKVTLPETVISIGSYAFRNCTNLVEINLPDTITAIGQYAFYGCGGLTGLELPSGITSLNAYTFYNCSGMTGSLKIPESVTSIGNYAFYGCSGFTGDLRIPDSVTSIGSYAFCGCTGFNGTLALSSQLTTISQYAFYNCQNITGTLVIPDSVTVINNYAFRSMRNVSELVFGTGIQTIGTSSSDSYNPFYLCSGVTKITFNGLSTPTLNGNMFYSMSQLQAVYVPAGSYSDYAQKFKTYLPAGVRILVENASDDFLISDGVLVGYLGNGGEVKIPDKVEAIGPSAFQNCAAVTKVIIPETVSSIGSYAFKNCTGLTEINLPDAIETIEDYTFCGCSALSGDLLLPDNLTRIGAFAFYNCKGFTEDLTFPDSVTEIGTYAFYNCKGFTGDLTIPNSVTSIGSYAFYGCTGFTGDLVIPNGVTSLGSYAFYGCTGFDGTLTLSSQLTTIPTYAFYNCQNITGTLVIPDSVTKIDSYAFRYMQKITKITFGSSVTSLYYTAFYNCTGVTEVTFTGTTVPTTSGNLFSYMSQLETVYVPEDAYSAYTSAFSSYLPSTARIKILGTDSDFQIEDNVLLLYLGTGGDVVIPDGVTAIGKAAFQNCTAVTSVTFTDEVTSIADYAFSGCTGLTELKLPENLESIGAYAFRNCTGLTELKLPENLESIGAYAFRNCTGISGELVIPDSVVSIPNYAFQNLTALTSIVFGTGIQTIGATTTNSYNPFYGCSGVTEVTFTGAEPPAFKGNMFYSMSKLETVYVPAGGYTAYAQKVQSGLPAGARILVKDSEEVFLISEGVLVGYFGTDGEVTVPDGVKAIGPSAFQGCKTVTSVSLPESVTAIGGYAFKNCTSLTEINLPNAIETIEDYAFYGCAALSGDLLLPDNLTSIGAYAFYNCKGFTGNLTIPDSVTKIGAYAFYNCAGFTGDLAIPDSVTSIGSYAFYGCTGFNGTLTLSSQLTSIPTYAFYNCINITGTLVIPDSVKTIDSYAFQYIQNITQIIFGSGITSLDYTAFFNCTRVKEITFHGLTVPTISNDVFASMSQLKAVYVPLESFSAYFKALRIYLPSIARMIPMDMTEDFLIEEGVLLAYSGAGGEVVIPDGVREIGSYAFQGCTSLTKVLIPEGVTTIGDFAFRNCTNLTEVSLPESLLTIGTYAFYNCGLLEGKLIIPSHVTTIGGYAFWGCKALTGLEFGGNVTSIGAYAFYNCSGLTGDLTIPDSVTNLGGYAFYGCSGLDGTLTLSANLTTIPSYAFYKCTNISGELVIPDKVTSIGDFCFYGMKNIDFILFGTGIQTIGASTTTSYNPFYLCTGVTEVAFTSETVPTFNGNMFYSMSGLTTIYVPSVSYDAYVEALSGYVGDSVVFSTDFLRAKLTGLKAEKVYSRTVALSWNPHTSDQVVGYTIFCNGEAVGTTTECSYVQRGLSVNTTYTFSVQGYTEDGRTSTLTQITATTAGPEILDIKTDSSVNKINDERNTVYIYVVNSNNLQPLGELQTVGSLYYISGEEEVLIGQAELSTTLGTASTAVYTVQWDLASLPEDDYVLLFRLTDVDGESDEYSETVTIAYGIPAQIVGVAAIGDVNVIHVTWSISTEEDTKIYRIYRRSELDEEFRLVAQVNGRNNLSYTDSNVKTDRAYYYYVAGVNELGQEGVPSLVVGATLAEDLQIPVVTKLTPASGTYLVGTVTFRLTAEDNVYVTKAELYHSADDGETWTRFAELKPGYFSANLDTTTLNDGVILVKGVAYDAAGNESAPLTYRYAVDNHGPEQVRGLAYQSTNVSITLSWYDVADDDIAFFRVEERNSDGTYTKVGDVSNTLGMNIYDLQPGTEYTYRVVGYDARGNRGTPSEDITAVTQNDTTAPVITKIRPLSGYYSSSILLTITAVDEHCIRSITVQTSADLLTWKNVYTQSYTSVSETQTLVYELPLSGYAEGAIYVRAIARDSGGNASDSGVNAPYVQHMIDRTAPAAPENVQAVGNCGNAEISWTQGSENDLDTYSVYRSDSEDGDYTLIKDGLTTINYYDRDVQEGNTYYYKVAVQDVAGNLSAFSEAVSATILDDTEPPTILAVYPESGSKMGPGNNSVSVTATDNMALDTILIQYSADGETYTDMYELSGISQYGEYGEAQVPVSEFQDGDWIYIRVIAADKAGNVCEPYSCTYVVDAVPPTVLSASAEYETEEERVMISWTGNQESDLHSYRIYRVVGDTYNLIGQCMAKAGQASYTYYDTKLPAEKTECVYRIEAVDVCGNAAPFLTNAVDLPDRMFPKAVISCDNTMEVSVEYIIDASLSTDNSAIVSYLFDFGDGTTSTLKAPVHIYAETGEYTITLTVTDDDGHASTCSKTITVSERSTLGTVKIQVLDENGAVVPGALVYFDLGEESQTSKKADSKGCVTFTSSVGVHTVGCVIANNEWLPTKKDIIVLSGAETTVYLTMVHQSMIEGEFEVNRMTFQEIEAAGIDVTQPENQHIVKVNIKLAYESAAQETSFIFNMVTKEAIGDLNYDSDGDGGVDRQIVPVIIADEKTVAFLDLPIGASFLKEFFDVRLHIINNAASDFKMTDNVVTMNVPDGLTIVETAGTESSAVVTIPEIAGQSTTTISWILRGDKEGEYNLSADYSGVLADFDEPIYTTFIAKEPFRVYGMSAVKLIAEVNSSINNDAFYFNLSLENMSDIDINLPSVGVIDNVLTTYQTTIPTEEEINLPDETAGTWNPQVRHLNTVLKNSSGYSQYIGTETALKTLSPGETVTEKYAVYNVTGYNNLMHLKKAIYEIAEGFGVQFEFIETDMDLFSTENAAEKLADIAGDPGKTAELNDILDCSQYFYVLEALNRDTGVFIREGSQLYTSMKARLGVDSKFSAEETKVLTRAIVAQLMVDESVQQIMESAAHEKYLEVTTDVLTVIRGWMQEEGSEDDLLAWNTYFGTEANIGKLASQMEQFGVASFVERLKTDLNTAGVSENGISLIQSGYADGRIAGAMKAAVGEVCGGLCQVIEKLDAVSTTWCSSAQILSDLIGIAAAQEEAEALLNILMEFTDSGTAINAELSSIRTEMRTIRAELSSQFAAKLEEALDQGNSDSSIHSCLSAVYGTGTGSLYALIRLTFGEVSDVVTWDGTMENIHVLSVCAEFSLALRQAVEKYYLTPETNDQALYTLKSLKYLIKMRLIGEQCFVLACQAQSESERTETLEWVNATKGTSFDSLESYFSAVQIRLLTYRDNLFATYYTNLEIPAAPQVTINYLTNMTNEIFSNAYEYSFEGSVWYPCTGSAISFTPGTVTKYLWVRVRETENSYSGNITKTAIPAMPRITGDISMIYIDDGYQISGLRAGTYQYTFTNERTAQTFTQSLTVADGEIVKILAENTWIFLALKAPASESSFESQIRYVVAEKPWVINTDTYVVTGMAEATTALQVVNYYTALGYYVTVKGSDGEETEEVGTGCIVNLDGESYAIVVTGDVNGDAVIDLFDLYLILSYINSETELEGVYHQAGCVCEEEDIELFDLYSEIAYINTGAFSD